MKNSLAELIDNVTYYFASSYGLRLIDDWELVMSAVAVLFALAWMISAKISFQGEHLLWLNRFLSHAKTLFWMLALLIIARGSFVEPVRISSSEWEPVFNSGQLVIIDRISWGIRLPMSNRIFSYRTPRINDIVMYNHLNTRKAELESRIRKVFAVAGDRVLVDYKNAVASIDHNNQKVEYHFQGDGNKSDEVLAFVIPNGKFFVATNTLRASNFSNPDYVTLRQIVGTPIALPF